MRALNRWTARNYRRGFGPRKMVLLLTTRGRRSGLPHMSPLQFERFGGVIYVGSARGANADWFQNLAAHPEIQVRIGDETLHGVADCLTDPETVADFLSLRLRRHPIMIRLLMHIEGLPLRFTRLDLERFAAGKAVAAIHLYDPQGPVDEGAKLGSPDAEVVTRNR